MAEIATTPPRTPPAIAPMLAVDPEDGVEADGGKGEHVALAHSVQSVGKMN